MNEASPATTTLFFDNNTSIYMKDILVLFQNEGIFVQLDELDKFMHELGPIYSFIQAQKQLECNG